MEAMDRFTAIRELIERKTGVLVDARAVWADIEEAAQELTEDGDHWITGQDDAVECWQYVIGRKSFPGGADIELVEIKITPRSSSSAFAKAGFKVDWPIYISVQEKW